ITRLLARAMPVKNGPRGIPEKRRVTYAAKAISTRGTGMVLMSVPVAKARARVPAGASALTISCQFSPACRRRASILPAAKCLIVLVVIAFIAFPLAAAYLLRTALQVENDRPRPLVPRF